MNSKQINALILQLKKIDFNHARIKIDNFELEINREGHELSHDVGMQFVTSPMIGIYHDNTTPIEIGDEVSASTVIGQIESMKLYNELVAEISGRISKVLVEDGQAVEFGQNLFEIEINEDIAE